MYLYENRTAIVARSVSVCWQECWSQPTGRRILFLSQMTFVLASVSSLHITGKEMKEKGILIK